MKLLKLYKKAGIIVFLLLELILFSAITPNFLSGSNFINLLRQIAMLGIASIGISFLMIGGASADLSIAGQIPVLSMLCGIFMMWMNCPYQSPCCSRSRRVFCWVILTAWSYGF